MRVADIEIEPVEGEPYRVKSRNWIVIPFQVSTGQGAVLRDDLDALIGETINGRKVVGVESFCVEHQAGRVIGLAFNEDSPVSD